MSWFSSWMHPGRRYKNAAETLGQSQGKTEDIYNQAQNYLNPYEGRGSSVWPEMNQSMRDLLHPEVLQNKWIQNYQESPYAKDMEEAAMQRGLNAMSQTGMLGSTPGAQAMQAGTTQIRNADRQQYLDDMMKKYLSGVEQARGIYGTGANAAGQLGGQAMTMAALNSNFGQNQAGLKYGEQGAGGNQMGAMGSFIANVIAQYLTGKNNIAPTNANANGAASGGGTGGGWNLFGSK